MHPADQSTIEQILTDYGVDAMLGPEFKNLLDELRARENVMVTEIAPAMIYRRGLDKIISQY